MKRAAVWLAGVATTMIAGAAHAQSSTTTYIPDPAEAQLLASYSSFDVLYDAAVVAGDAVKISDNVYRTNRSTFESTSLSIYNTITPVAVTQNSTVYSTEIVGKLLGRGTVFDQTYGIPSGTAEFNTAVAEADRAVTAAGAPLFVRLLAPRLTSSATTTTSLVVVQDKVTASPLIGGGYGASATVIQQFGPATVQVGFLGLCTSNGSGTSLPSGCSGGKPTTLQVAPGNLLINTNLAEEQKITQTTTTTTATTDSEVWEVDGIAALMGTIHAVVPVAGFDQSEGFAGRLLGQIEATDSKFEPWLQGWGQWNRTNGGDPDAGAAPGDTRNAHGFDVGASFAPNSMLRLGAAIDYGKTDISIPAAGERGKVEITEAAGFGRVGSDRGFYLAFGGGYGWGHASTDVSPAGAGETSSARENLRLGWATGELGWRVGTGRLVLTPVVGATFTRVDLKGFAESGSDFGLRSNGATVSRTLAWAGLNAAASFGPEAHAFTVAAAARAVRLAGDRAPVIDVGFADDPAAGEPLAITAPRDSRWGANVGATIAYRLAPRVEAFVGSNADLRSGGRTIEARGGLRMRL